MLFAGVGGQGVLRAAQFVGDAGFREGLDVSVGQIHGLAQKGGSVQASVFLNCGKETLIRPGALDLLVGFEPLEAARALDRASGGTTALVARSGIPPFQRTCQGLDYPDPEGVFARIRSTVARLWLVDDRKLGEGMRLNTVLLGALASLDVLPFGAQALARSIEASSGRHAEANRRAFELGASLLES